MDNNFNNGGFAPQQPMQGQPQGQPMQQQQPVQQMQMQQQPVQQMQMQQQQPVQQQPQPVAAGGNMFDAMYGGFNDVKSGGTGQYPKPGAYLFKIVEVVNGQTSDGKMLFAAELEVISSTVPEHGPGTRLSSLVLFKNQNHLSTYQRQIKSFLHAAIAGVDPNTQFQNITPEVAMWATGGDQPLAGRYIRGQFALAMSKNNRQYTKESWAAWSGPGADPGPAFDSTTLEPVQMQEAAPVMMQQAPVQPQQGFQPQAQQGFAPQPQPQAQQGFQPQPQPQPQVQQGFAPQQQPQPQVQQGFAPQQQPQVQPGFAPQPQPQPQAQPGFAPQQPQQQPLQQPNMAQPQFGGGFTPQQ